MRGLVILFLAIVSVGIGWRYIDRPSKAKIKRWLIANFPVILMALFAVAVAIVLTANTTMRFL